jgi:hypothetical protein
MGEHFAARGQRLDRRIGAADAGAADGDEQIAWFGIQRGCDGFCLAPTCFGADDISTCRTDTVRDQQRRHRRAGRRRDVDQAQPRAAHGNRVEPGRSRH